MTLGKQSMMRGKIVTIPAGDICDWPSFHRVFAETLGFPAFYGRTMNAWIDCMTSIDEPGDGMSAVTVEAGELLIMSIENAPDFKQRCPEQFAALLECSAFVNDRRVDIGGKAVLALMFSGHFEH